MNSRFQVYRLTSHRAQFDYFYPTVDAEFYPPRQYLRGEIIGAEWTPPAVRHLYPEREKWDIAPYVGPDGLVVTERGRSLLAAHLDHEGIELLSLRFGGTQYWVVNVLDVVDCLDLEHCIYPPDRPWAIESYAFAADRFHRSLFKLPQHRMGAPYVVEDAEHPERGFKSAVEKHCLRGVGFKLIWEG